VFWAARPIETEAVSLSDRFRYDCADHPENGANNIPDFDGHSDIEASSSVIPDRITHRLDRALLRGFQIQEFLPNVIDRDVFCFVKIEIIARHARQFGTWMIVPRDGLRIANRPCETPASCRFLKRPPF
jgi:hypothetical protein